MRELTARSGGLRSLRFWLLYSMLIFVGSAKAEAVMQMETNTLNVGGCRITLYQGGGTFHGLGAIWIGGRQVRSGRLPLLPSFHTFATGLTLTRLELVAIDRAPDQVRIRTRALGIDLAELPSRDYHLAPVFSTGDWGRLEVRELGELDVVLTSAEERFGSHPFSGFSYHYEYRSPHTPLYFLQDRASWELDGDVNGVTVYSQSVCADPLVTFESETAWTTEERLPGAGPGDNPVITHAYPRWAGHQAFDYQFKGDATLLGVYERLGLIRTVLRRDAGQVELKTFDTHWFNETLEVRTPAKSILLNTDAKTVTCQRNLWTDVLDEVNRRARAEVGMKEVGQIPFLGVNYWHDFTYESYRKDLLPAAAATGVTLANIDNVNRNAMTEKYPDPNQCQSHDYEPAPSLGGVEGLKSLVEAAGKSGVRLMSWTSTAQGPSSPLVRRHRHDKGWFIKMEDGRTISGDTHTTEFFSMNLASPDPRSVWTEGLRSIRKATGLDAYYLDMFWNVTFAPVNFEGMKPGTQWREALGALRDLQEVGTEFQSEISAFTQSRCGYHANYQSWSNLFLSHKLVFTMANQTSLWTVDEFFRILAHQSSPSLTLFYGQTRIDHLWTEGHRQALSAYVRLQPRMYRRLLQEDGQSVLWHNQTGDHALLWNFAARRVALPGRVTDLTTGKELPSAGPYSLLPQHIYEVAAAGLPQAVEGL